MLLFTPLQLGALEQSLIRRETLALTMQLCSQLTKKISAGVIKLLEDRMAIKMSGPDGLSKGMSRIVTEAGTSTVATASAFSIPAVIDHVAPTVITAALEEVSIFFLLLRECVFILL